MFSKLLIKYFVNPIQILLLIWALAHSLQRIACLQNSASCSINLPLSPQLNQLSSLNALLTYLIILTLATINLSLISQFRLGKIFFTFAQLVIFFYTIL